MNTPVDYVLKLNKDNERKKIDSTLVKQIVGSLMYLTTTSHDIMQSVSMISRYMENPTEKYLLAAKRIFLYLQGTKNFELFYKKRTSSKLIGFTDSDYTSDQDDQKSTFRYVFILGSTVVSWSSKKQPIVTLSTTKVEYIAAAIYAYQAIWLKKILEELHFE